MSDTPDTIIVTTLADVVDPNDGLTSLREAILAPDDGFRGKTIVLGEGTYTLSRSGTESPETRDFDIYANVTIVGNGAGRTTINGNGIDRIFEIFPSASLALSNLTLTGGNAMYDRGGAIYNKGEISLTDVTLDNNRAAFGGAIYNDQFGVAAISDTKFLDNQTHGLDGGRGRVGSMGESVLEYTGYNLGYFMASSGLPGGNGGDGGDGSDASGGAIYNALNASITIVNSELSGNGATGGRGGDGGDGGQGGPEKLVGPVPTFIANELKSGNGGNGGNGGDGGNAYGGAVYNQGYLNLVNQASSHYIGNTVTGGSAGIRGSGGLGGSTIGGAFSTKTGLDGSTGYNGTSGSASGNNIFDIGVTASNIVTAGNDSLKGAAGSDFMDGAEGNDQIEGFAGNDTLTGGAGNDRLDGGLGIDRVVERSNLNFVLTNTSLVGNGTDTLLGIEQAWLVGGIANNILNASAFSAGAVTLDGGAGNDNLSGGSGSDILLGGSGSDSLIGGAGDDTLAGEIGSDSINGGSGSDILLGGSENDSLNGGAGDDTLVGEAGSDSLAGGAGNDAYIVENVGDRVLEVFGEGTDSVQSSITYSLAVNVENLTLTGSAANDATGNTLANILIGNAAANKLNGGTGTDSLQGGMGNDTYIVDNTGDKVLEVFGEGTDSVQSSVTYSLADNVENLTLTGSTAINGTGNDLANTLTGNAAANILNGGKGADTLRGGVGNDTYIVDDTGDNVLESVGQGTDGVASSITYTLGLNVENLTLTGTAALNGTGNVLANTLKGNAAANILDGGSGIDTLQGGTGNDTYVVDNAGDTVLEYLSQGFDSVLSSVTHTLALNVEKLTLTGTTAINGTGNDLANTLNGNAAANILSGGGGNDLLNGGTGADSLQGGMDNDIYIVDNTGDKVLEIFGEGTDSVQSSVTYSLADNIENLTLTGSAAINGTGNDLANTLTGNAAANILNGGKGADTLRGGVGNDTYIVDDTGDNVLESVGQGTDGVASSITYTLGLNVENLTLTGTAALNGTGNVLANTLKGNAAANILDGGSGIDTLQGGTGNDTYVVDNAGDTVLEYLGQGFDSVLSSVTHTLALNVEKLTLTGSATINATGNTLANVLIGNTAANILDGGAGIDTLQGSAGNDTYIVDSTADKVLEGVDQGTDKVQSSVTFTLSANIENLTLTGTAAINGTGNDLANTLSGNAAANVLSGGLGNDLLNGGTGADSLQGGMGNDTYIVDNTGDKVLEVFGEGADSVQSSITYSLAVNVENLTLTGSAANDATGNTLANVLIGNAAANMLNGGTGTDSLQGGMGNDTYIVDNTGDKVLEVFGEGTDSVQSSITYSLADNVENLTLTGSAAINGTGNILANVLTGNTAANVLTGQQGNDTYVVDHINDKIIEIGGGGRDTVLSSVTYSLADNVEDLTLTGTAAINATGNGLANTLTGNVAANTLTGAGGDDTYGVDNAGDEVVESLGGGIDTVRSSISYTLVPNTENLVLTGTAAINGTGNDLDNILLGNPADNILTGGKGSDTFGVDNIGDQVLENAGEGTDTVQSSIDYELVPNTENLVLTGTVAVNGTGNALNNHLTGNTAANILNGGLGVDTLRGEAGADTFIINTTAGGTDLVLDFDSGVDHLRIGPDFFGSRTSGGTDSSSGREYGWFRLIVFTQDIDGPITAATAADRVSHIDYAGVYGDQLFVFDNGEDSAIFQYHASYAGGDSVVASELTLIATLENTAQTTSLDYLFA